MSECVCVRTGDDLQVDDAAFFPCGVAGGTHVLPRHVAAQVGQLQNACYLVCREVTHTRAGLHTHTHTHTGLQTVNRQGETQHVVQKAGYLGSTGTIHTHTHTHTPPRV